MVVAPVPRTMSVQFFELRRPVGHNPVVDQGLQKLAKLRRSRGKELRTMVELVTVRIACCHAPTDAARLFEDGDFRSVTETPGKHETGQAGSDDRDSFHHSAVAA